MTEFDFQKYSTNLVVGKNGVGKSVLTEVITFVLYGKPFRKINKPLLVNSDNKNNLLVEIDFKVNNKSYTIIRGIKPNIFEIWEDGVLLNQDAKNLDYQDYLENDILCMNFITFTQLIVLGKATHVPFMSLPAIKRREMIEHLLGISVFKDINLLVKEKIRNTKLSKEKGLYTLDLLNEKLEMKHEYQSNTKSDRVALISNIQKSIDSKENEVIEIGTKINAISEYVDRLKHELFDDVSIEHNKFNVRKHDIITKVKSTNKEIEFFEKNTICPTCTQNIDNDFRVNYISGKHSDLIKLENGSMVVNDKIKEFEDIEHKNNLINNKIREFETDIKHKRVLIRRLQNEIIGEIERLENESENVNSKRDIGDEIRLVEDSIKNQVGKNKQFNDILDYYYALGSILDDDGVKSLIIKKYLPLFNKYINAYLNKLGLPVTFMLDDQFNETILARHRTNFTYNSFSEGQKLRIDLAIMMSWRDLCKVKNSMDSNLLIMDEIFDSSLEQDAVDAFIDILVEQKHMKTFVISHTKEKLQDRFENTIEVSLLNGFSQIKEIEL